MRGKPFTLRPGALSPSLSLMSYRGGHKPAIPTACGHAEFLNRTSPRTILSQRAQLKQASGIRKPFTREPPGGATSAGLIRMITPRRARGSGQSGCATWAWRRCRAFH
jgi:hypothetical protein